MNSSDHHAPESVLTSRALSRAVLHALTQSSIDCALHPTYVRSYYYTESTKPIEKGRSVSWPQLLSLAAWVVTQRCTSSGERDPFRDDEDWSSSRSAIANVLNVALTKAVPFEHRELVWKIILSLTHDREPTRELEQHQGESGDPASLAVNTIRGKAIEAVIQYALWVRQHQPESRDFSTMARSPPGT